MNPNTFALILFIATYVLMIALPKRRPLVALISAVIFVATGVLPLGNVLGAIDFNVLLMSFAPFCGITSRVANAFEQDIFFTTLATGRTFVGDAIRNFVVAT